MRRRPGSWDPLAWNGPWKGLLLAASVLGSCFQPAPGQTQTPVTIVLTPPSPVVGGNVSLAPQNPPQDFVLCSWYRSATAAETSRILTCFPHTPLVQQNGPAHTGLETAGPGCALHITGLTLNDTGNYTVQIQSPTSPGLGTVVLRVYEMLPRPTVTPNQTLVLENKTFTLRCNSSPSADTVLWLRDGASLASSDRLVLSSDNRTLKVLNVTRGDAGAYQCEVGNPVSSIRSEPGTVTVAYGPESVRIDPPGPITLTLGSPLTLTCVADSIPAPSYRWGLNGTDTNQTGSSLTFNPMTLDHQGTYECRAHNPITNRTVSVCVTSCAPVFLALSGQVYSPSVNTKLWLQDRASLVPSEQLGLSPDNRTLMMLGVTQDDAGAYQGEVGNPISTNRCDPIPRPHCPCPAGIAQPWRCGCLWGVVAASTAIQALAPVPRVALGERLGGGLWLNCLNLPLPCLSSRSLCWSRVTGGADAGQS
uniref:Ig-like domain-containing protein n=1 Tax=Gopherus evgoodei TaxID=1825980 RepID=A0A8C4YHJ4_9SAUR